MSFPLVLGIAVLSLGVVGLLVAWLHPSSTLTAISRLVSWPRKTYDRADLVLKSVFLAALGSTFLLNGPGGNSFALLAAALVVLGTGIAIGVRRPAV